MECNNRLDRTQRQRERLVNSRRHDNGLNILLAHRQQAAKVSRRKENREAKMECVLLLLLLLLLLLGGAVFHSQFSMLMLRMLVRCVGYLAALALAV